MRLSEPLTLHMAAVLQTLGMTFLFLLHLFVKNIVNRIYHFKINLTADSAAACKKYF